MHRNQNFRAKIYPLHPTVKYSAKAAAFEVIVKGWKKYMSGLSEAAGTSADVKAYLSSHNVAALLEKFIASLVQEKPSDVLLYLEAWAREARTGEKSAQQQPEQQHEQQQMDDAEACQAAEAADDAIVVEGEDPAAVVRRTWQRTVLPKAGSSANVAAKIFEILFLQHRALKRTEVFDGADLAAAAKQLGAVLESALAGEPLTDEKALDLVADHPVVMELDDKVFQYLLSATHMAVSTFFSRDDNSASQDDADAKWSEKNNNAWNIVLTEYKQLAERSASTGRMLIGKGPEDEEEAEAAKQADKPLTACEEDVKDSWSKTPEQRKTSIIAPAFATLFAQHAAVQRTAFADFDPAAAAEKLLPLLKRLGENGNLQDSDLEQSGLIDVIRARDLQFYHVAYCQQALLSTLPQAVSGWSEVQVSWRKVLTNVAGRIEKKFFGRVPEATAEKKDAAAAEQKEEDASGGLFD